MSNHFWIKQSFWIFFDWYRISWLAINTSRSVFERCSECVVDQSCWNVQKACNKNACVNQHDSCIHSTTLEAQPLIATVHSPPCVAQHQEEPRTGLIIRCLFDQMQKLLSLVSSLFQWLAKALKGGESWFLVIDEVIVAQEDFANQQKQLEQRQDQAMRRDDFNRRYESQCFTSSSRLTFLEIWMTLSPISLFKFLRYSLSDVVWSINHNLITYFVV